MPSGRSLALILFLSLSLLDLSGCVARRRVITRNGGHVTQTLLSANKQELLDTIAQQYNAVHEFSATVDMVPALGSTEKSRITEYKDVRGYIMFRKPADIRIIGLYPVVRSKAFDMVSDGKDFRLYLPTQNRFIEGHNEISGPSKNKIENLRPQHFLEAMLISPRVEGQERAVLENFTDEDNAAYILHLIHPAPDGQLQLSRTVWFDRLSLRIVRQMIFDPAGNVLTDARYSEWQTYDGVPFPKHIEINRPRDEYAVVITVVKMDINRDIAAGMFVLPQPEGTVLQVLGQPPAAPPKQASRAPSPAQKGKKQNR